MYCKNCGKEIDDNSIYCSHCGARQDYSQNTYLYVGFENKVWGILSIVFAFLMPVLGIVFGVIGLSTYKDQENRKLCKIGIGIVIAEFVLAIILMVIFAFGLLITLPLWFR